MASSSSSRRRAPAVPSLTLVLLLVGDVVIETKHSSDV